MTAAREAIRHDQLQQLNRLLNAIIPANRFYARKWEETGLSLPVRDLDEFVRVMPFTTKEELCADSEAFPPYGSNLTYPLAAYNRFNQTSGTSGTPLRWLDTPESWAWMVGNWRRVYHAANVTREDRVFFAFSFGPFLGFWTAYEAATLLGALCIPGGGMTSVSRLQAILDNHVTVLCCTPTYAIRLAETAREEGIDIAQAGVRTTIVAGEPGGSVKATRERIETLWPGVRVFDHHGMTEVGPVSYESPHHPGVLHVIESSYLAEVIEPETGKPVATGGEGELVLTTLGRLGMPLVRYRTGDLVRPHWEGVEQYGLSDLALEGGIIGRIDDMVMVRGVNIYPSAVENLIRSCRGVAEYRVVISDDGSMSEMHIEIEPENQRTKTATVIREVERLFRSTYHLRIPVTPVPPGTLPRFEMKARRWIRS